MRRMVLALAALGLLCVPVVNADPAKSSDTFAQETLTAQAKSLARLEAVGINEVIHIHHMIWGNDYSIFRMTVADYGCTEADDFKIHLLPRFGETWVYVERIEPDECFVEGQRPEALEIEINVDSTLTMMVAPHRILNPVFSTYHEVS